MRPLAGLGALTRKEFRQTLRDRRMMFLITAVPLVQLVVFGYAVNLDVSDLATVVVDLDRTEASRHLGQAFTSGDLFRLAGWSADAEAASRALETGEAAAVLVLPSGLAGDLARGRPARVQVLVDGTNPNVARIAGAAASEIFGRRGAELLAARLESVAAAGGAAVGLPRITVEPRVLYNPALASRIYMVPGVAATLLLIVTTISTAVGIARERETGTLEQIMVTPMRRTTFILGKTIPFAILGYLDVLLVLTAGIVIFGVPARGPLSVLALATGLYLVSTLGTGLFISTISATQQQAYFGGFLFMFPAILLSGFMSPVENMPDWIRPLAAVNPVRYFVEILRGCLLRGAGWSDLAPQLAALAVFGLAIMGLSVARFRKRL